MKFLKLENYEGIMSIRVFYSLIICVSFYVDKQQLAVADSNIMSLEDFQKVVSQSEVMSAEVMLEAEAKRALAIETNALKNPTLRAEGSAATQAEKGADKDQVLVSLEQPLRISDFGARGEVSELLDARSINEKKLSQLKLKEQVRIAYAELWSVQARKKITAHALERAKRKLSVVKNAVSQGLLSKGDELLFQGEASRLASEALGIESEEGILFAQMASEFGFEGERFLTIAPKIESILPLEDLIAKANKHPLSELSLFQTEEAIAKAQHRVSELDGASEVSPSIIYERTNDGGDFLGAGLSVSLPIWDRNQAEQVRSLSTLKRAKARSHHLVSGGFQSKVRGLWKGAKDAIEQTALYENSVVPAFSQTLELQEQQYQKGQTNILQVWQSHRALQEAEEQAIERRLSAVRAISELSVVVGFESLE